MTKDFASFNFANWAKIRENAKFNLAKFNPIKVRGRARNEAIKSPNSVLTFC